MAPFKLLLSQTLRHHFLKPTSSSSQPHLSLLHFSRTFCSSSSSQPPEPPHPTPTPTPPPKQQPPPISIQPVSYPIKPKDPSDSPPEQAQAQADTNIPPQRPPRAGPATPEARAWTREDIRYVKDIPNISPVAYPARVAPLPGDKPKEEGEEGERKYGELNVEGGNEELDRERRRIEAENREMMRRVLRVEEEKLPFPTLIKVDNSKKKKVFYDLKEAIQLVKANAKRNFDETLEAHVRLNPELRRTDLKLSGSVQLPHGGPAKSVRVAVFAEGAAADEARDAGADVVGGVELIEGIKNGTVKVDYDMCFATDDMMVHMKQIAKYLRRLMPTAKNGGVTKEIGRAVKGIKGSASVLFKKDKTAIVHVGLGKVNFPEDALRENVAAFVNALLLAKPAGLKKSSKYAGYVESFYICSTMGPSFPVTIQSLSVAADRYNRLQRV